MAREARPRIWVVVMHARLSFERALLAQVCAQGAAVLYEKYGLEAAAYYVDFSPKGVVGSAATDAELSSNICPRVISRLQSGF